MEKFKGVVEFIAFKIFLPYKNIFVAMLIAHFTNITDTTLLVLLIILFYVFDLNYFRLKKDYPERYSN